MNPFLVFLALTFAFVGAQETSEATSTATSTNPLAAGGGAYNLPPPPHGGPPIGGPIGGLGFPGLGFHKNFDFNAGYGLGGLPLGALGGLGGLGGLLGGGGVPPIDGDIPPPLEGGFGGGGFPGGGFGGFGQGYVPATWIGSALGAKGDLLFPIVIFVFFVVGVWTVIQLLLGFIVPLIASKLAIKSSLLHKAFKRDVPGGTIAQQPDLDFITTAVLDAINEPKCLKYVACHTGKFLYGMSNGVSKDYEGILKALSKMAKSEALDLFEDAFMHGNADCTKFTCEKETDNSTDHDAAANKNNANEIH